MRDTAPLQEISGRSMCAPASWYGLFTPSRIRAKLGYETWPKDAWKRVGGANCWGEISLDENRGIVYVPTASPKYNFYGADRLGADLFGDCLLALDARTGKLLWYFQMVHHDIWDYDNATAPKLLTVWHDGRKVDAVAQVGQDGIRLGVRPRHGQAALAGGGAAGAAFRHARRRDVAHSAVPAETAALRPASVHRQRPEPVDQRSAGIGAFPPRDRGGPE